MNVPSATPPPVTSDALVVSTVADVPAVAPPDELPDVYANCQACIAPASQCNSFAHHMLKQCTDVGCAKYGHFSFRQAFALPLGTFKECAAEAMRTLSARVTGSAPTVDAPFLVQAQTVWGSVRCLPDCRCACHECDSGCQSHSHVARAAAAAYAAPTQGATLSNGSSGIAYTAMMAGSQGAFTAYYKRPDGAPMYFSQDTMVTGIATLLRADAPPEAMTERGIRRIAIADVVADATCVGVDVPTGVGYSYAVATISDFYLHGKAVQWTVIIGTGGGEDPIWSAVAVEDSSDDGRRYILPYLAAEVVQTTGKRKRSKAPAAPAAVPRDYHAFMRYLRLRSVGNLTLTFAQLIATDPHDQVAMAFARVCTQGAAHDAATAKNAQIVTTLVNHFRHYDRFGGVTEPLRTTHNKKIAPLSTADLCSGTAEDSLTVADRPPRLNAAVVALELLSLGDRQAVRSVVVAVDRAYELRQLKRVNVALHEFDEAKTQQEAADPDGAEFHRLCAITTRCCEEAKMASAGLRADVAPSPHDYPVEMRAMLNRLADKLRNPP
jgi:hypothetical protein